MATHIKLRAAQREGEKPDLDRHWRGLFLDTLAETSNVSQAARKAGASTSRAYKTRRLDAEFRAQWDAALLEGYEHLELETLYRLRHGIDKDEPKFDVANAIRLLMHHRENAAREKARQTMRDEESVLESLSAKISKLRESRESAKRLMIEDHAAKKEHNAGA